MDGPGGLLPRVLTSTEVPSRWWDTQTTSPKRHHKPSAETSGPSLYNADPKKGQALNTQSSEEGKIPYLSLQDT